jgi:dihydrofolate reductase
LCVPDPAYDFPGFFKRFDSIFVGRKTYEMVEGMDGGPSGFPKFKEYVFSGTLDKLKEGVTLIRSDIRKEVEKIKNEEGKDIWLFGGASLTSSLMNLGLVDELSLAIYPILLGSGKPLFKDIRDRIHLRLMDTKTYPSGLIGLSYRIGEK